MMVALILMAVAVRCDGARDVMEEMLATWTRLPQCDCPYPEDVEADPLYSSTRYQAGGDQTTQDGVGLAGGEHRVTRVGLTLVISQPSTRLFTSPRCFSMKGQQGRLGGRYMTECRERLSDILILFPD